MVEDRSAALVRARRRQLSRKVWAGIHHVRLRRHVSLDAAVLLVANATGTTRVGLLRRINPVRVRQPSLSFREALERASKGWPERVLAGEW